jgi:hypothetical protein
MAHVTLTTSFTAGAVGRVTVKDAGGSTSDTIRVVDAASVVVVDVVGAGVGEGATWVLAFDALRSKLYRVSGSAIGGGATLAVAKLQLEVASTGFATATPPTCTGIAVVAFAEAPSREGPTTFIRTLIVMVAPRTDWELP